MEVIGNVGSPIVKTLDFSTIFNNKSNLIDSERIKGVLAYK